MNDRFLKIMQYFNLTPSAFADEIGVNRPGISHIISGRNRPGVDLLQKVLKRFPNVSTDWLLMGTGAMFRDNLDPSATKVSNQDIEAAKHDNTENINTNLPLDFEFSVEDMQPNTGVENEKENKISSARNSEHNLSAVEHSNRTAIRRITVYFADGSFQDFHGA